MDKSWIKINNRVNPAYRRGVDEFLQWAFNQPRVTNMIRCPCKGCRNTEWKTRIEVRADLLRKGFSPSYEVWDSHGEVRLGASSSLHQDNGGEVADDIVDETDEEDDIIGMLHDAYGHEDSNKGNRESENHEPPNKQAKQFFDFLQAAQTDLYPGCDKVSKLSFIVRLLHLKCLNHWSNKSMDSLLSLFKDVLPEGALIPNSYYEAKKVIQELGMNYTKIDACENDCILYWQEHTNAQSCPKCNMPRWRSNSHRGKKIPHKVLRYFPIKPRLQRLYMSHHTAKEMRWHNEERIDDGVLRHPADSIAWKSFNQ